MSKRTNAILHKLSGRIFLIMAACVAIFPFLNFRVLRMAGDEKVYVSQAVEMARDGRWFVQTLADEPSYYKGPMHYLLIRIGMALFGNNLIAATWMNGVLALLAALAMYRLGRSRWGEDSGILLGVATALNIGVISHAFASQMEVELCAFYAFAAMALGFAKREPTYKNDVLFWLVAGMAGWIKSPVHSVLISAGGLLYWLWNGQLASRIRSRAAWLAVFTGIAIGVAGYLPALIADPTNFYETFILREQFTKANNGRAWHYVLKPLLHFALPWTFIVLAAFFKLFKKRAPIDADMARLGASLALPTLLMWATWSYKGQNYNLPAMPALLLFAWACFDGKIPRLALRLAGALGVLTFLAMVILVAHFWPLPEWWNPLWLLIAFACLTVFSATFLFSRDARVLGLGAAAFCIAFSAFITPLGEREMVDMRRYLQQHPHLNYYYYNLDPSIWSEWGLLQLVLHHKIYGLHRPGQLEAATKPGQAVIVQNMDWLKTILDYWQAHATPGQRQPVVTKWARWLTKGRTAAGESRWKAAWKTRDLSQLEREFYIIAF